MTQEEEMDGRLARLIEQVDDSEVSSIKSVVSGVLGIINDPRSTAKDLKDIIQIDPPLTARLLKMANSAYYSPRVKINEIDKAVIWIGFDALKELALSQKVCEIFDKDETIAGYSRSLLWKHSIAVALTGKMIFRREFGERGDNVYAAGLLHDIGMIIEDQFFQEEFTNILIGSKKENKTVAQTEREVLGYDHAEVGRALSEHWNFPRELSTAIGSHHDIDGVPFEYMRIAATLYVANRVCQEKGIGYSGGSRNSEALFKKCLRILEVKPLALEMIASDIETEIRKMEDQGLFEND